MKAAAVAVATLLGCWNNAQAQQPAGLESVVVTANKRVERLDNVPSSISVLTEEALQRNNVKDFNDVVALTPSLTVNNAPSTVGNNSINMRGIGTASFTIGVSPDVAVLIDDIPIGMQVRAFQDLADLQRIEVLKGPQSTLFGRAAIAGAVNIVSRPITGKMAGSASASYSDDNESRLAASYGGAISDTFGMRVSLGHNDFRGNIRNLELNQWTNGSSSKTAAIKLHWRPHANLDLDLTPRYNSTFAACCTFPMTYLQPGATYFASVPARYITSTPVSGMLAGINPNPDNLSVRSDNATLQTLTSYGTGFKAAWSFDSGHTLTVITGFEKFKSYDQNDGDNTNAPLLRYYTDNTRDIKGGLSQHGTYDTRSVSQELRLNSPDTGDIKYVAGLWYAKNDIARIWSRGITGIALTNPKEYHTSTFNKNVAAFGQASWDFAPSYSATAGLRLNRETSGYEYHSGLPEPYPTGVFVPTLNLTGLDGRLHSPEASDNAVTGKVSLQHQFTPSIMGYTSYSTGYKGYAYDLLSTTDAARASIQPVDPETARSYEIGGKGNFLNNTLTVNAALFRTLIDNFQSTSNVPVIDALTNLEKFQPFLNSVGAVRTQGLELDVAALASKQLLINAAFAYTDARITYYPFGDCYAVPGSANGGFNANCIIKNPARGGANTSDKAGNQMPYSPKYKLTIGGQYDFASGGHPYSFFVNGNVRYQSQMLVDLQNDSRTLPGYALTNMGFGVRDSSGKYKLTLNVNNLFDRRYALATSTQVGQYVAADGVTKMTNSTWMPARDSFRYFSLRLDAKF